MSVLPNLTTTTRRRRRAAGRAPPARAEVPGAPAKVEPPPAKPRHQPRRAPATVKMRRRKRTFSPITLRILALNVLALAILVGGLLYLGEYQRSLIRSELETLKEQGRVFAGALGEGAVVTDPTSSQRLKPLVARQMLRRLVAPTRFRVRLFGHDGALVADSRRLMGRRGLVKVEDLPPPRSRGWFAAGFVDGFNWIVNWLPRTEGLPRYREAAVQRAEHYPEVITALTGETAGRARRIDGGGMILSFAVPVQRYKTVAGVVMLSTSGAEIERNLRAVRLDILKMFGVGLGLTLLLSLYLARAIARPIRRLASAAERIRRGEGQRVAIPDFSRRRDEIGDLSGALRDMTEDLWSRMEAIEQFAADVAHELKNPLSSLRSAVETATRLKDGPRHRELMDIILEDVERLDRLITDISHASRLDAELVRGESEIIDVRAMLTDIVEMHAGMDGEATAGLRLKLPPKGEPLTARAASDRLGQVLDNLIVNAKSFSPPKKRILLVADGDADFVSISVEDRGPGIPEAKLEAVFDRFYTERPAGEKFGRHSGLGLSISKQIIEAQDGTIHVENVRDAAGRVKGARFVIRLPRA